MFVVSLCLFAIVMDEFMCLFGIVIVELIYRIQDNAPWCMFFIHDVVLLDTLSIGYVVETDIIDLDVSHRIATCSFLMLCVCVYVCVFCFCFVVGFFLLLLLSASFAVSLPYSSNILFRSCLYLCFCYRKPLSHASVL